MFGMLYAIPKTPLHARLAREGRLDPADHSPFGTNVIPARISREALRDGYTRLMTEIYEPDAYFARLRGGLGNPSTPFAPARARYWRSHPLRRLEAQATNLARAVVLYRRLMRQVADPRLRRRYRREIGEQLRLRRDPGHLFGYVIRCAMHYHHHTLAAQLAQPQGSLLVNSF
jgi:hypothetical protein